MGYWSLAYPEFFVVVAFGIGWLILEWYCKRLDKLAESNHATTQHSDVSAEPSDPAN